LTHLDGLPSLHRRIPRCSAGQIARSSAPTRLPQATIDLIIELRDKLVSAIDSTPVSGNDKSMSESVKTSDGTVNDPVSAGRTHPNSTAERLDEHIHSNSNRAALSGETRAKP
jgi:hypothetical protein